MHDLGLAKCGPKCLECGGEGKVTEYGFFWDSQIPCEDCSGTGKKQRQQLPVKLVELRNPWGKGREWRKDWSDASEMWSTISREDKERLWKNAKDGKFFMSLQDFHRYFGTITVCYYPKQNEAKIQRHYRSEAPGNAGHAAPSELFS